MYKKNTNINKKNVELLYIIIIFYYKYITKSELFIYLMFAIYFF